jgi:Ca-activated chloride channel family protein
VTPTKELAVHASVRLDHTLLAVEGEHDVHAMLELSVPALADAEARPPLRLALVLDRSGSMGGAKLAIAKRCAAWLASRLRPEDELALVDYDDEVRLLAPLAPARERELLRVLGAVQAGGQTNLSGGWLKGVEQLRGADGDGGRTLLLLTDGLANVGITEPDALVALARGARDEGVATTTIGFGDDFDEELLTAFADAGGGNAHWAATPDAAPAIFAQELEGLTRLVAQNVSVEIRPREQVEVLAVLNEYPQTAVPGGVQIALGDAYGGERRRIVFGLHVPYLGAHGVVHVADLVLRYVSVGDEIAHRELTVPVTVNAVSAAEAAAAAPDGEVREEVLVLKAARAREDAVRLADAGRPEDAKRLFLATASELRAGGLAGEAEALLSALPAVDAYSAADRKRLWYESNQRRRRRDR